MAQLSTRMFGRTPEEDVQPKKVEESRRDLSPSRTGQRKSKAKEVITYVINDNRIKARNPNVIEDAKEILNLWKIPIPKYEHGWQLMDLLRDSALKHEELSLASRASWVSVSMRAKEEEDEERLEILNATKLLNELEDIFDKAFNLELDYVESARSDAFRLRSIPITTDNALQLVRLYKKIAWLLVHPRDYKDGLWATF